MSSRMGQVHAVWSEDETDRLNVLLDAGWTPEQIAADLGRSLEAIRTRRRKVDAYGKVRRSRGQPKPKSSAQVRLRQLAATTAAAASERKVDAALVEQYRKGLLTMLAAVHRVNTRSEGVPSLLVAPVGLTSQRNT